jgi:hypothetical protein
MDVFKKQPFEQLELENLKFFNPTAQEYDWDEFLQQSIHIRAKIEITVLEKIDCH